MNKEGLGQYKNNNTYIIYITIIITILAISSSSVNALGIAPAKKILDYGPDLFSEQVITSRVINNEGRDVAVRITVSGELAEYVTINDPLVYLSKDEPESEFTYTLDIPYNVSPGTKTIWITVNEISIGQDTSGGSSIGGLLTVAQQLVIDIPAIGKYAEGYLSLYPETTENKASYSITITNKGTERIESFDTSIQIIDSQQKTVYSKEFKNREGLDPWQLLKIEEQVVLEQPGVYILESETVYNNNNITLSEEFTVGKYTIAITGTSVDTFRLGTIAKFDIGIGVDWNTPISDVYGEMIVKDDNGTVIDKIGIDKKTISSNDNKVSAYWDTANVNSGNYFISILLYAGDQVSTKEYYAVVSENKITVEDNTVSKGSKMDYVGLMAIALVVFALIVIILSIYKSRHRNN